MRKPLIAIALVALSLVSFSLSATHLRCGQIRVEQLEETGYSVRITIQVWTNSGSTVTIGGDQSVLDFGDGDVMAIPETLDQMIEGLPPFVAFTSYTVHHTYTGPGKYIVSYREPNRNEDVRNFLNSVATAFYIETMFVLDTFMARYETPAALHAPIFAGYSSEQFSASLAAVDPNDYTLRYESVVPLSDRNTPVEGFQTPESFSVSEYTGLMTWDTKFMGSVVAGEFLFAVRISQFATKDGKAKLVGYMLRDYQVFVEDGATDKTGRIQADRDPTEIFLEPEATASFRIFATHESDEEVTFKIRTELPASSYITDVYDSVHDSKLFRVARIVFQNSTDVMRDNLYVLSVRTTFLRNEVPGHYADTDFSLFTEGRDPFENLPVAVPGAEVSFKVGPNPAPGFVDISSTGGQTYQLYIYNNRGCLVSTSIIHGDRRIDLSQHPAGLYFFVLQNQRGGKRSFKILRE